MTEASELCMLQIYGQPIWHSDANLLGTISGLTALRDALTTAIESGEVQRTPFFPSDGEGYGVVIKVMTPEQLDRQPCWYDDEIANPGRYEHIHTLQRRVFELEAALRKVRIHNRSSEDTQ